MKESLSMRNMLRKAVPLLLCLLAARVGAADSPLTTLAERSSFERTERYEEVGHLCAAFEARWASSIRCTEFGRTPQGRPDRKSTRLNSSHVKTSYAVFCSNR